MKVYTKIVYDKDDNIIQEQSYDYNGPVAQARFAKGPGQIKNEAKKIRSSKLLKQRPDMLGVSMDSIYDDAIMRGARKGADRVNLNDYEGLDESNFGVVEEKETTVDNETALQENVLHKFATYNTIFTLSGISEDELKSHAYLSNPVHDIIARSGGIGDPKISDGQYKTEMDKLTKQRIWNEQRTGAKYNEKYDPKKSVNILSKGLDLFFENFKFI